MSSPAEVAARPREEKRENPLALEPDGRSWTARENLVDVVERELLGPLGGPEEVLATSPDAAYLVGRIAPYRLTDDHGDPADADGEDTPTDVGNATDAEKGRGVPVTAVDDSGGGDDEDGVEDRPPQRGLMIPESMGLRFKIPTGQDSFTLTASWGVYRPVTDEDSDADGRRLRRFERAPVQVKTDVAVADRLEFAVGRTCSVDWREVPDTRRADAVWTTWLPTCETPQTSAEEVDAALLRTRPGCRCAATSAVVGHPDED